MTEHKRTYSLIEAWQDGKVNPFTGEWWTVRDTNMLIREYNQMFYDKMFQHLTARIEFIVSQGKDASLLEDIKQNLGNILT
jgi:hypothetical protein